MDLDDMLWHLRLDLLYHTRTNEPEMAQASLDTWRARTSIQVWQEGFVASVRSSRMWEELGFESAKGFHIKHKLQDNRSKALLCEAGIRLYSDFMIEKLLEVAKRAEIHYRSKESNPHIQILRSLLQRWTPRLGG